MDELSRDEIVLLAMELDIKSIINFSLTCKKINKYVFENNHFWRNRLHREYPFSSSLKLNQNQNFRKFYQEIENHAQDADTLTSADNSTSVFAKPLFIRLELADFLLQADLGFIRGTKIPVNYIIWSALKKRVLSRNIISRLFVRYFENKFFSDGKTKCFHVDDDMNRYLSKYLKEIEESHNTFNRNKFVWKDFALIINKMVMVETQLTTSQIKELKTTPLYNLSEAVLNRDKRYL